MFEEKDMVCGKGGGVYVKVKWGYRVCACVCLSAHATAYALVCASVCVHLPYFVSIRSECVCVYVHACVWSCVSVCKHTVGCIRQRNRDVEYQPKCVGNPFPFSCTNMMPPSI